jgi:hypothetical protein
MSRRLKKLLWWSAGLIVIALILQRIQMDHRLTIVVGVIEVLLAVGTGIAFGVTVASDPKNEH